MAATTYPLQTSEAGGSERIASPCIFVVFGASGDLTKRKLLPALISSGPVRAVTRGVRSGWCCPARSVCIICYRDAGGHLEGRWGKRRRIQNWKR